MKDSKLYFHPIGVIRSPHTQAMGTPIQPCYAEEYNGTIEINSEYLEACSDLNGFERIWLFYSFDSSEGWKPKVKPFRDKVERGLFATRAPKRPNAIGMSCVRLLKVEGSTLHVSEVDILDGTALLDIKPYVPDYDSYPAAKAGWLDNSPAPVKKADQRFVDKD